LHNIIYKSIPHTPVRLSPGLFVFNIPSVPDFLLYYCELRIEDSFEIYKNNIDCVSTINIPPFPFPRILLVVFGKCEIRLFKSTHSILKKENFNPDFEEVEVDSYAFSKVVVDSGSSVLVKPEMGISISLYSSFSSTVSFNSSIMNNSPEQKNIIGINLTENSDDYTEDSINFEKNKTQKRKREIFEIENKNISPREEEKRKLKKLKNNDSSNENLFLENNDLLHSSSYPSLPNSQHNLLDIMAAVFIASQNETYEK
jgi:hypothetical protein